MKLDPATAYFFFNGPDGIDKTFFDTTVHFDFRAKGKIVFYVASLGVAAFFILGKKTLYTKFKFFINSNKLSICHILKTVNTCGFAEKNNTNSLR